MPKWVPAGTHRLSYRFEWSPESHTFERRIERQWSGRTNIKKDHIIDTCLNEKYDPIILTRQYHYDRTSVDGDCSCALTCSYFSRGGPRGSYLHFIPLSGMVGNLLVD